MGKSAMLFAAVSLSVLAAMPAAAQPKGAAYHAPKNGWGQPDLQGTYTTATITPVTRDAKYGTRNVLTKEEASRLEQATRDQVKRADEPTPPEATVKDLKNADCGADGISGFNCGYNHHLADQRPVPGAGRRDGGSGAPGASARPHRQS
jgi:ABC-type sugar transport system substrate-binding protein